jgi:hypothetical protein
MFWYQSIELKLLPFGSMFVCFSHFDCVSDFLLFSRLGLASERSWAIRLLDWFWRKIFEEQSGAPGDPFLEFLLLSGALINFLCKTNPLPLIPGLGLNFCYFSKDASQPEVCFCPSPTGLVLNASATHRVSSLYAETRESKNSALNRNFKCKQTRPVCVETSDLTNDTKKYL